jgi:mannose-1-phosphate guanylyltransferase
MLVTAGLGTRLGVLSDELPKPAMPVANRPAAWFALDHLARFGVREIVLNTHHLADRLRAEVESHAPPGLTLTFVHEPRILGTGGGVRNAWHPIDGEHFVVMNGKLVFAPNLDRAMARHEASGAIATLVLRAMPTSGGFGAVEVDPEGHVRRIRGLPATASATGLAPRMFTGVQILAARAWRDLPDEGDVIEHAYARWLERGETVLGVDDDAAWVDVGVSPRDYLRANLALARGHIRWPGIMPGPGCVIADAGANLGPDASVTDAVVGAGARLAPGVRVARTVLWPGARCEADLTDAIVTSAGRVVRV